MVRLAGERLPLEEEAKIKHLFFHSVPANYLLTFYPSRGRLMKEMKMLKKRIEDII